MSLEFKAVVRFVSGEVSLDPDSKEPIPDVEDEVLTDEFGLIKSVVSGGPVRALSLVVRVEAFPLGWL